MRAQQSQPISDEQRASVGLPTKWENGLLSLSFFEQCKPMEYIIRLPKMEKCLNFHHFKCKFNIFFHVRLVYSKFERKNNEIYAKNVRN